MPGLGGAGLLARGGLARTAAGVLFADDLFAAGLFARRPLAANDFAAGRFVVTAGSIGVVARGLLRGAAFFVAPGLAGTFAVAACLTFFACAVLMLSPPDRMASDGRQTGARQSWFPV